MTATSAATAMSPTPHRTAVPPLRGRIGGDPRSGHYAAPHRYRLHLSPACPDWIRRSHASAEL